LPARVVSDVQLVDVGDGRFEVSWTPPERGGTPLAYRVTVSPVEGESKTVHAVDASAEAPATVRAEVPGDDTVFGFDAVAGTSYVATVQAVFPDGPAPVSNASLVASLTESTPTTSVPAVPAPEAGVAPESTDTASGSLPTTGRDLGPLVLLALVLAASGLALVVLTRRARARS
jgi:hypothetical protein